jgi:tRNA dimethylallyltransferase
MQFLDFPDPLVVIVGPTAVGKSAFAIALAQKMEGEIVSADSRLFYRGMDIGTAKPSFLERQLVPHHLIDVTDPDEPWSLVLFQDQARQAIASIHKRNHLPFLVGGTGQYIQAVIEGWQAPLFPPNIRLRQSLEEWGRKIGPRELHRRLNLLDPEASGHIEPGNLRRTVRALEVIFSSGRRFSEQRLKNNSPYSICSVGLELPRSELYKRIDTRIERMITEGLMDEVNALLARGYAPDLTTFSAIGYRQMIAVMRGEIVIEEAIRQMKRLTHQFVRRQANWFKESDPRIHWIDADESVDVVEEYIRTGKGWVMKPSTEENGLTQN